MTKVMMTFHLTVLHFLPLNPVAPYSVLRTLYSVLCTPPELFRPPVSPGAVVSALDSYYFQSYT
jgi:hypothetical protein